MYNNVFLLHVHQYFFHNIVPPLQLNLNVKFMNCYIIHCSVIIITTEFPILKYKVKHAKSFYICHTKCYLVEDKRKNNYTAYIYCTRYFMSCIATN